MKKPVVVVVVVALLLGAAAATGLYLGQREEPAASRVTSSPSPVAPSTESAADATEPPDPALASYYSQQLTWEGCEGDFECATLEVPLDYAKPEGTTIDLALLRQPASGQRIGSMVVNPGGPGAPGTDYAKSAAQVFRKPLTEAFDVVGFDPRGTGDSSPVDCVSDAELDAILSEDPDPDDAEERASYRRGVLEFGRGCTERSGDLAAHVSTIEAARDIDVLRAALGEARLTYFGASYGTKLGATYAELFPDKVGRLVLDGAVDPTLDNRELGLEQAAGFETALRAYVQNCVDSTDSCFLGDSVEEGMAAIADLLTAIDAEPLPAGGDRELTVGNAFYGIVTPLYNRDYWYLLSAALRQARGGDGTALMLLADLYASRNPDGSYSDNSMEAIVAINCLDDPSSIGFGQVEKEYPAFEAKSPTFGKVFAWSLTTCRGTAARTTEDPIEIRAEGAEPILVIGTSRDPATPVQWAESLADQLDSGVLLLRDGDGHTGYNAGNECVDVTTEAYLLQGKAPDDGKQC